VTKEEMLARFDGWSEPVKNVIRLIEKPDIWALFDHLPAATYHHKGQICLLGDSAHASTPHHGAGAGMAVEDALILSKLLASIEHAAELESAFVAYDAVRRPRSQQLVTSSRRIGKVYDFEDEIIGDDMDALREYLEHAWDWIWTEDLNRQLEKAHQLLKRHQETTVELRSAL
jgi:salicylate hydroxylase